MPPSRCTAPFNKKLSLCFPSGFSNRLPISCKTNQKFRSTSSTELSEMNVKNESRSGVCAERTSVPERSLPERGLRINKFSSLHKKIFHRLKEIRLSPSSNVDGLTESSDLATSSNDHNFRDDEDRNHNSSADNKTNKNESASRFDAADNKRIQNTDAGRSFTSFLARKLFGACNGKPKDQGLSRKDKFHKESNDGLWNILKSKQVVSYAPFSERDLTFNFFMRRHQKSSKIETRPARQKDVVKEKSAKTEENLRERLDIIEYIEIFRLFYALMRTDIQSIHRRFSIPVQKHQQVPPVIPSSNRKSKPGKPRCIFTSNKSLLH